MSQTKSDNINRKIATIGDFYLKMLKCYHIKRLITLTSDSEKAAFTVLNIHCLSHFRFCLLLTFWFVYSANCFANKGLKMLPAYLNMTLCVYVCVCECVCSRETENQIFLLDKMKSRSGRNMTMDLTTPNNYLYFWDRIDVVKTVE